MVKPANILAPVDANAGRPAPSSAATAGLKRVEKKEAAASSKKKERMSSLCKTPPQLIRNAESNVDFRRGACIGEGGFARCFSVKNSDGQIFAAKTVAKASLTSQRVHQKLLTEIKIHKSMNHNNIVKFVDCFEDSVNVYMLLEMCVNSSLSELLKTRKRLTTPEVRFFSVQLMGAVLYMHSRRVIHRDLKLGNIFLDDQMNIKIGDFGLATVMAGADDRKKTICGTPNYIAPEVLYGKTTGHSFEVDIWAIGVIVYTMLYGKPPFQDKCVDEIYERIRKNEYSIPQQHISEKSDKFVSHILIPDPAQRPSVYQILVHPFFTSGPFPANIPTVALKRSPAINAISKDQSQANFAEALRTSRIMRKEQAIDFAKSLFGSVAGTDVPIRAAQVAAATTAATPNGDGIKPVKLTDEDLAQGKGNAMQRSRAVLPKSLSPITTKEKYHLVAMSQESVANVPQSAIPAIDKKPCKSTANNSPKLGLHSNIGAKRDLDDLASATAVELTNGQRVAMQLKNLDKELEIYNRNEGYIVPNTPVQTRYPTTFIMRWVDVSLKYGIAYQLTDGVVGLLFKDRSTMISDRLEESFMFYKQYANGGWIGDEVRKRASNSKDLSKRFRLLSTFRNYMDNTLKIYEGMTNTQTYVDRQTDFLCRYERQKNCVIFDMHQGNLQVNFSDHVKVILSQNCSQVDILDEEGRRYTWTLSEAIAFARQADLRVHTAHPVALALVDRLKVCRKYLADRLDAPSSY